jgi:putative redox protein
MTTTRHVARAIGSTTTAEPPWRAELRAGRHQLVADEPATNGGDDAGPTPFGLLLGALAACTAMTLRMYVERKGWGPLEIEVDVSYDLDDDGERSIRRTITLSATLTAEQRDRLADIAERTPVTVVIRVGTPIATAIREAAS